MKCSKLGMLLILLLFFGAGPLNAQELTDEEQIKEAFETTYCEVFCKKGDPQLLRKTFHPVFQMFTYYNDEVRVKNFEDWVARLVENRGKSRLNRWEFVAINVTGHTANAVIRFFEGPRVVYTDYFSLYKLEDGWKVFAKTFNIH